MYHRTLAARAVAFAKNHPIATLAALPLMMILQDAYVYLRYGHLGEALAQHPASLAIDPFQGRASSKGSSQLENPYHSCEKVSADYEYYKELLPTVCSPWAYIVGVDRLAHIPTYYNEGHFNNGEYIPERNACAAVIGLMNDIQSLAYINERPLTDQDFASVTETMRRANKQVQDGYVFRPIQASDTMRELVDRGYVDAESHLTTDQFNKMFNAVPHGDFYQSASTLRLDLSSAYNGTYEDRVLSAMTSAKRCDIPDWNFQKQYQTRWIIPMCGSRPYHRPGWQDLTVIRWTENLLGWATSDSVGGCG